MHHEEGKLLHPAVLLADQHKHNTAVDEIERVSI
jgi:hypothetical protein